MGVAMCMYAGVGTQLFSFVKRGTSGGITRQVNFGSFGNTFLVLFQIMTSESISHFVRNALLGTTRRYLHRVAHLSYSAAVGGSSFVLFCGWLVRAEELHHRLPLQRCK
jgi:Ion transport protein